METTTPIPFTDAPVEHETGSYIITKFGLLFEGHKCFNQLGIYLQEKPLSYDDEGITIPDEAELTQYVRTVAEMPISWWRAQCAFRGLDTTGEIADLQIRLSDSKDIRMLADLTTLEKDLTKDYWLASRAQRKKEVPSAETGDEFDGKNVTELVKFHEARYGGPGGRTERRSRGGFRGGRRGGRVPSRKPNKRGNPAFGEVMKRFGSKPAQTYY